MVRRDWGGRLAWLLIAGCLSIGPWNSDRAYAAASDPARSRALFEDARKHLENGDTKAAIIQLKSALEQDPNNAAARRMLGKMYLSVGNGPYAEKELKAFIQRHGDDRKVRFMLAEAYLMQGKFRTVLKEIVDDSTDTGIRVETLLIRGRAYLGLRRINESENTFKETERLRPGSVRAKLGLARGFILRRRIGAAETKVDAALALKPDNVDAVVLKAELRRLNRDLESALAHFNKAIAVRANNLPARLGRAATLIDLNRAIDAKADIYAVYARFPRHPLASYLSALILVKKKDFIGAQDALQQGGPVLDRHPPSLFLSGAINYALNRLEPAVLKLTRYVKLAPGNLRAVKLLAAALIRSKEPRKVIELLEPLVDKGIKDAQILTMAGGAYMRLGKIDKATVTFEKAAVVAPDVAAIRTQLAIGRLFSGQSDQAIGDLEAAVDLDPGARQASILLAQVQLRKGKFDAALKSATALRAKMPGNPMPDNLIGAAHLGSGDVKKARRSFRRALKTNPNFHSARMNLAQLDLRENKTGSAIAHFKLILENDPRHVDAMLALVTIAERENRPHDAVALLQRASAANPASIVPRLRLIQHHGRARAFRKAVAVARDLVRFNPGNPRALVALGRTESALGEHVSAVATFRRLTELAPKSASAFTLLAGAQIAAKDEDSARRSLKKAVALDDKAVAAHVALANLEARAGATEEAMKIAGTLQKKLPRSAAGYMLAGDLYMRLAKYGYAIAAYQAGLEKEDKGTVVLRRFNAQMKAGLQSEALAALQEWVDRKNAAPMRHILALAYINAKRHDDAIRESEILFAKDARNAVLLNNLAWLYDQKGDNRAVTMAEKALALAPKKAAILDTLGWILVRRGRLDAGLRHLETASLLAPNQGNIGYRYAVALQKSGKFREARRKLTELLGSGIRFSESKNAEALLKELGG